MRKPMTATLLILILSLTACKFEPKIVVQSGTAPAPTPAPTQEPTISATEAEAAAARDKERQATLATRKIINALVSGEAFYFRATRQMLGLEDEQHANLLDGGPWVIRYQFATRETEIYYVGATTPGLVLVTKVKSYDNAHAFPEYAPDAYGKLIQQGVLFRRADGVEVKIGVKNFLNRGHVPALVAKDTIIEGGLFPFPYALPITRNNPLPSLEAMYTGMLKSGWTQIMIGYSNGSNPELGTLSPERGFPFFAVEHNPQTKRTLAYQYDQPTLAYAYDSGPFEGATKITVWGKPFFITQKTGNPGEFSLSLDGTPDQNRFNFLGIYIPSYLE